MSSSELVVKTEDKTLREFHEFSVAQKILHDLLTANQHHLILWHPFYLQQRSQLKIIQDRSFSLLKQLVVKETFCSENTPSAVNNNYVSPMNEQYNGERSKELLVENLKELEKFEAGAEQARGYCSTDEGNVSIENFDEDPEIEEINPIVTILNDLDQNNEHNQIIGDQYFSDDNDEDGEEYDSDNDNENEIGNAIDCFVIVQSSCPGLLSQKLHHVARITDEKLIDGQVQFTVNFYEKSHQDGDRFLPCVSNLKTNINIDEEDIILWLGDPTMDSFDDGLKFPFDFKNYNL